MFGVTQGTKSTVLQFGDVWSWPFGHLAIWSSSPILPILEKIFCSFSNWSTSGDLFHVLPGFPSWTFLDVIQKLFPVGTSSKSLVLHRWLKRISFTTEKKIDPLDPWSMRIGAISFAHVPRLLRGQLGHNGSATLRAVLLALSVSLSGADWYRTAMDVCPWPSWI